MFEAHVPYLRRILLGITFSVVVLLLDSMALFDPARVWVEQGAIPLQVELLSFGAKTRSFSMALPYIFSLHENFTALEEKNAFLRAENARLRKLKEENATLYRQLTGGLPTARRLLPVQVLRTEQEFRIHAGKRDGIAAGMPVILGDHLIGRVDTVGVETATAQLTTDPRLEIAVSVEEGGRQGIVRGSFGAGIKLSQVLHGEALAAGQLLLTSGRDGQFPPGLTVGEITRVTSQEEDIFQSADAAPLFEIGMLETVFVVLEEKG